MKAAIILISTFLTVQLFGQEKYKSLCTELKIEAFNDEFDYGKIEKKCNELMVKMDTMSEIELRSCNCADTLWVSLLRDRRRFISYTHSIELDTHSYLRMLSSRMDIEHLKQEFRFENLRSLQDSLKFVLDRMRQKDKNRNNPEYNWQTFYHCVEAEVNFLKENKYKLKDTYFRIFDDSTNCEELRDRVLLSFFNSNETIEIEILNRINHYIGQRYFYRMLGVLRTSGTDRGINHLVKMMDENDFNLNIHKSILQTIYVITDRQKIKRRTRNNFDNFLKETQLDTLSRYELFIKE